MAINIEHAWRNLLLACEVEKDSRLESTALDSTYAFPVLTAVLEWIDRGLPVLKELDPLEKKELLESVQVARSRIADLRLAYRDLVFVTPGSDGPAAGVVSGALVLPKQFYCLVEKLSSGEVSELDGDAAALDAKFGAPLKDLLDRITALLAKANKANQPFWTYGFKVTMLQVAGDATGKVPAEGYWVALDQGAGDGKTRARRWLLPAVREGDTGPAVALLAAPRAISVTDIPAVGVSASISAADPRSLVTVASQEGMIVPGGQYWTPSTAIELTVWKQDPYSELSRAAAALCRFGIDGSTAGPSLWDQALELDPPAIPDRGAHPPDEEWTGRRLAFESRLKAIAPLAEQAPWQVGLDVLSAAVWARRLQRAAAQGLAFRNGDKIQSLLGWTKTGLTRYGNAQPDTVQDATLIETTTVGTELHHVCAYFIAMRLGAASSSSGRTLEPESDATSILGVAGTFRPPELVYVRASGEIGRRLSKDSRSSLGFETWVESQLAPNSYLGRPLVPRDVVSLARITDEAVDIALLDQVVGTILPQFQQDKLGSPALQEAIVAAMAKAFRNHRRGGMPALLRQMANGGGYSAGGVQPGLPAVAVPGAPADQAVAPALLKLLGKRYRRFAAIIAAPRGRPPIRGSRDIVQLGRGQFVRLFENETRDPASCLSEEVLRNIFSLAWTKVNARAQFIARNNDRIYAPQGAPADAGVPDLETLFRQADLPACTWGASIHGPAAYLADILEFLRHRRLQASDANGGEKSALELLLERRPDLAEIDLTGANAEVEMPFIDLVCELLERTVAGNAYTLDLSIAGTIAEDGLVLDQFSSGQIGKALAPWGIHLQLPLSSSPVPDGRDHCGCPERSWILRDAKGIALCLTELRGSWSVRILPQTTLPSEALLAEPQYLGHKAYAALDAAFNSTDYALPWSLGESATREYLALVDLDPHELLMARGPVQAGARGPLALARACATLGIPQAQGRSLFEHTEDYLVWRNEREIAEDALSLALVLERAGIGFPDLLALKQAQSLRNRGLAITPPEGNPCGADANAIRVHWVSEEPVASSAYMLSKFLRLRKHLGWSIDQLDRALVSPVLGRQVIDAGFACALADLQTLQTRLNMSLDNTLAMFNRLRTTAAGDSPSPTWRSIFVDTRSTGADSQADNDAIGILVALADGAATRKLGDVPGFGERSEAVGALVAAALRIPPSALEPLIALRFGTGATLGTCTVEHLSHLHGTVVFMRALDVPLPEFAALLRLNRVQAVFDSPVRALRLCDLKESLDGAGLSAQSLYQVLSGGQPALAGAPAAPPWRSAEQAVTAAQALHAALHALRTPGVDLLLAEWPLASEQGLREWGNYLALQDATGTGPVSALQLLEALAAPVRRLLPRFDAERPSLRRQGTMLYPMGPDGKGACAGQRRLLADVLPDTDAFERGLADLQKVLPTLETAQQFLAHELTCHWVAAVYAPVLQWAGASAGDVAARLGPWTGRAWPVTAENPLDGATWLLTRPLQRREALLQREEACAAALASFLGADAGDAWSLASAMPANEGDVDGPAAMRLADWFMHIDSTDRQEGWADGLPVALERARAPGPFKETVERLSRLARGWQLFAGLALGKAAIDWLEDQAGPGSALRRAEALEAFSLLMIPGETAARADGAQAADVPRLAARWQRLAQWAGVFRDYPDIAPGNGTALKLSLRESLLGPLLASDDPDANRVACCQALAALHGLESGVVSALLPADGPEFARWLALPAVHRWLDAAVSLLARTGLAPAGLQKLTDVWSDGADETQRLAAAANLRKSLRKRFSEEAWAGASRKGQDRLRSQKRDALVAYLLGTKRFGSVDELYETLLLDTQMAACMTSSRIVQAHAAVQQFVQRCVMGLDAGWRIPMEELADWKQWDWMKHFRVWEASRKIFLYPENWMDPEIRDDKSAFFSQLESDLNQGELSHENADAAFTRYLHKLNDVARLDVVATYYEFDPDMPVMHILGRTPSEPRRYFYRQWIDERRWTPWEFVDLEIDGNQVLLFKRAGRLYVGWMTATREEERRPASTALNVSETAVENGKVFNVAAPGQEPAVRWKLQLSTSERAKEGWQAKRVSPGVIHWPPKAAPLQEVDLKNRPDELQLLFQDFGIPEILVMRISDVETARANGRVRPAYREQVGSFMLASGLGLGVPEVLAEGASELLGIYPLVDSARYEGYRYIESASGSDDRLELVEGETALASIDLVRSTPGRFSITLAQQASPLDLGLAIAHAAQSVSPDLLPMTMGVGLPMFYSDESVDIAIRSEYRATGGRWHEKSAGLKSREFGRIVGQLARTIGSVPVQDMLARFEAGGFANHALAGELLQAIARAAPQATPAHLLEMLRTVGAPQNTGQTFHVAARNHHPLAGELVRRAEERGVAHVFSLPFQLTRNASVYRGRASTGLSNAALETFGEYALSFDVRQDAYACYNWEVFFHAPYMIAMRFVAEAKFEDALRWFHHIFDPTGVPEEEAAAAAGEAGSRSFWKVQPFHLHQREQYRAQRIDVLLDPAAWGADEVRAELGRLADSIMEWRRRPNMPFQVGRSRWVAFQKAVVYRFIETLVAWADSRFRVDTREDITAATQLYLLAKQLLGRKPRTDIDLCGQGPAGAAGNARNYAQLRELIDQRDDKLSQHLDTLLGDVEEFADCCETNEAPDSPQLNFYNEYFCIPPNEKLLGLWDIVADRLYKIRNCQNIDGIARSLALFAPPIDPALLARAGAVGLSFDQIIAGLNQPRAHYRFAVMIQKANEVANELRILGNELLQALEKRDAEELALLRSRLELQGVRLGTDIRDQQIADARAQIDALDQQSAVVAMREKWYGERVGSAPSAKESEALEGIKSALVVRTRVAAMKSSAAMASMLPRLTLGVNGAFGSPHSAMTISGELYANAQNFFADKLSVESDKDQTGAGITATLAAYERRDEDWGLQHKLASGDLASIEKQRIAAEIRLQIATLEKRNLLKSIESSEATDAFLKAKFTNAKLYDWMVRQVSGVYFKTYQMALDLARAAEDCLNRELPFKQGGVRVIQPGYWDGLRKGLMAATPLIHDLKRLELESIQRNKRTPELTKHVSLAVIDPVQLMELRASGECTFRIPEALFDLDHPGQFARRIKSVSLSIPCITGPYTGVSCELALRSSEIRTSAARGDKDDGANMLRNPVPAEAIYTSSASNDGGQFELNLKDERYLPFEGAGAANSEWRVSLPGRRNGVRQFDYQSISDVVLQIRYTAEAVAPDIAEAVAGKLAGTLNKAKFSMAGDGLWLYASLRADLADQFNALLMPEQGVRRVTVRLPAQLSRWMGSPIMPSGGLSVRVIGQGRKPLVAIGNKEEPLTRDAKDAWLGASFDANQIDGKTLVGAAGFELRLTGLDALDDVVLLFHGQISQ